MFLKSAAAAGMAALAFAAPASAGVEIRTDLTPGEIVRYDGIGVEVPAPGRFIAQNALNTDGTRSLGVLTQRDGTVLVTTAGPEETVFDTVGPIQIQDLATERDPTAELPEAGAGAPGECQDGTYNLMRWEYPSGVKHPKWKTTMNWYFKTSSAPDDFMTVSEARDALLRAVANVTQARNNCGLDDQVNASQNYHGATTAGAQLGADGDICVAHRDRQSVVAFGPIADPIALARNCIWGFEDRDSDTARIAESDTRINANKFWTDKPEACTFQYMLEGVMTHEFGHAYGLWHVGEREHGQLTMSTKSNECSLSETTLGLGDVRGLRALY